MRAATLTDHLAGWPDDRLERLFALRPDLCHPPVPDFAALAARASTQMSVLRALDGLNRAHLDVLEALAVLSLVPGTHDAGPAGSAVRLAAFFQDAAVDTVQDLLEDLAEAALVVGHGPDWQLPAPVATALGPHPLAFGRPAAVLADGAGAGTGDLADLPRDRAGTLKLLRRASRENVEAGTEDQQEDLLTRAAAALEALQSSPVARLPEPPGPVHDLLLRTGLLVRRDRLGEHPLEAGLAWRDGTSGRPLDRRPPPATGRPVPGALSRNAALAAIGDLLRACATLLDAVTPGLPTLRSGGVGVRELKRLAEATGSSPEDTAWLLELVAAAGLSVLDPDTSTWRPDTAAVRDWRRSDRHVQWAALTAGWLSSGRAPMLGPPPAESTGGAARALAPDRNRPDAPRLRAALLETARDVSADHPGSPLDPAVAERQRWRAPRQSARTAGFTPALLAEAERLGLTGAGALTEAGALVAAGHLDQAAAAVGQALPPAVTTVRLQGDLTAVAPGYLDPEVDRRLAGMAEAEGDGAARVYRFSDASVHRALDAGSTAAELEAFLAGHSDDEVPQSLRYLIRDVARRHGLLAAGPAGAWLRSEDPGLLDAIVADPEMSGAQLERLAPTVVVAGVGPRELHRLLAAAGHRAALHRAEDEDGPPAEGRQRARRAVAGTEAGAFPEPVRAVRWSPSEEELAAQIARLRSAPTPAPTGPGTEEAVAVLRQAAARRARVDLVTVDQRGRRQSRRVVPLAVAGGRVRCLVPDQDAETVVPLHRVVSADAVPVP
ncbi:helicase-associated domain-containing protein [Citricoccus sp. I39-566]|uniref:helicase-associated domain-containing protein n=1 Tax=Citricoccus sp. I39-566 TaxID=3073268 RepID=UPI00286CC55B|nr:helicase-associated domain-containing protein [Citricoccus sp. I39-566]WMY79498.1 helicase-associated domain-containing protein [Citricoccus sp. I39-566]